MSSCLRSGCAMEAKNVLCFTLLCNCLSFSRNLSIIISVCVFSQIYLMMGLMREEPVTTGIWAHRAALIRIGMCHVLPQHVRGVCLCACARVCYSIVYCPYFCVFLKYISNVGVDSTQSCMDVFVYMDRHFFFMYISKPLICALTPTSECDIR